MLASGDKRLKLARLILFFLFSCALVLALFWNLELRVLIEDEAIRGLVAIEMYLSGNHVIPTLNGELYFKKPPLFNWMILSSYILFGEISEWTVRLPSVLMLLIYSFLVYLLGAKLFNREVGLLSSLALITNGRILFYDSMLGLIDISFSMCIFLVMYSIIYYGRSARWSKMYAWCYILAAIAFMFKGLPAIVFLGFSLLALALFRKSLTFLYHRSHIFGILIFSIFVGTYLLFYSLYGDLPQLIRVFIGESAHATPVDHGIGSTLRHLLSFPLELCYHFLPFSLLMISFFIRPVRSFIYESPILRLTVILILCNIWVYWISPRVFPRYLFMFLPFYFYVVFSALLHMKADFPRFVNFVKKITMGLSLLAVLAILLAPIVPQFDDVPYKWLLSISCIVVLTGVYVLLKSFDLRDIYFLIFVLLLLRINMNHHVLPLRLLGDDAVMRSETERIADKYKHSGLSIIGKEDTYNDYSYYTNSFYLSIPRDHIVDRKDRDQIKRGGTYILDPALDDLTDYKILDSFPIRKRDGQLYIVQAR